MVAAALLALSLTPFCPALGRELSWDSKGAYALDTDVPFTPVGREIVKNLVDSELGKAELLARYRLENDKTDLVPAWALSQILRFRKNALGEYHRSVEGQAGKPDTVARLLFKLYVCRLAENEMPP